MFSSFCVASLCVLNLCVCCVCACVVPVAYFWFVHTTTETPTKTPYTAVSHCHQYNTTHNVLLHAYLPTRCHYATTPHHRFMCTTTSTTTCVFSLAHPPMMFVFRTVPFRAVMSMSIVCVRRCCSRNQPRLFDTHKTTQPKTILPICMRHGGQTRKRHRLRNPLCPQA